MPNGNNCPKCGAPVQPGARFCPACGATIAAGGSAMTTAAGNLGGAGRGGVGKFIGLGVLALLVIGLGVGGCLYGGYTRVIGMDEQVKSSWAQVENQLQRRYDLIPNLVETVKGVAGQEQKVFLGIAEARKAYFQASNVDEKARAAGDVERALSRLLMLQETYPQLKSNESFLKLQDSIEGTENRLSVERMRYNETVRVLNTYIRGPLGALYAGLARVKPAQYFQVEAGAKETPKVNFSTTTKPG